MTHLWTGEDKLMEGDMVKLICHGDQLFTVMYIGEDIAVVKRPCEKETCVDIRNVLPAVVSKEKVDYEECLSSWRKQSLETAYDHDNSKLTFKQAYRFFKDYLSNKKGD